MLLQNKSLTHVKWLLASDSAKVIARARAAFGDKIVTVPGDIVHVDRLPLPSSEAPGIQGTVNRNPPDLTRTLVEHLLLARAEELVSANSGFVYLAHVRGGFRKRHVFPFYDDDTCVARKAAGKGGKGAAV